MWKETPVSDVNLGPWQCADCSFVSMEMVAIFSVVSVLANKDQCD